MAEPGIVYERPQAEARIGQAKLRQAPLSAYIRLSAFESTSWGSRPGDHVAAPWKIPAQNGPKFWRHVIGLTSNGSFQLPLTQEELGDTMGLSNVHVNRSLKELRDAELVTMRNGQIVISDVARLKVYSGFDPSYLHLERTAPPVV